MTFAMLQAIKPPPGWCRSPDYVLKDGKDAVIYEGVRWSHGLSQVVMSAHIETKRDTGRWLVAMFGKSIARDFYGAALKPTHRRVRDAATVLFAGAGEQVVWQREGVVLHAMMRLGPV